MLTYSKIKVDKETIVCISVAAKPGNFGANFHNAAYKHLNLDWVYIPRKVVSSTDLEKAIIGVRALNIKGCSVSMPHKETVIQYLDNLDISAAKICAVNTILHDENGDLKGYNTDFYGAKKALENYEIKGKTVLMVGAGGAARAIGLAVKELGGVLTITNRTLEKAQKIGEILNTKVILWEKISNFIGYLLINATSIGMNDPNNMCIKKQIINNFDAVMDVVIYPSETKLIETAKSLNKKVIYGRQMCVYQAAEQFKIYTGMDVPTQIINSTLKSFE